MNGDVAAGTSGDAGALGQRQLETMVEAENKRFRELFDQAPVFLVLLSGPEFRIEYVNKAYEQLVGRSNLVGKTVAEALPEIEMQGFIEILHQVYERGQTRNFRDSPIMLQLHSGGALEQRYLDFIYQPIVTGEEVTGLLVVGHDVTEQHFAEERVRVLRRQLRDAGRLSAMATVADTLAHELNQPLTAITNYAVASRTLLNSGEDAPGMLDKALKAIAENAHRAGEIIRRLRDMTERGRVRHDVFDLEEAIREAADLAKAGECEDVELSYDLEPGAKARGDRVQVQQVLLNLIRNAHEAGEKTGQREVTIATAIRGQWLEVSVRDRGKGIAPEDLPDLFEPFGSTKPEGMGLGLSISRTIVESQGGRIWARNVPDGGAVFCFTVPNAV